MVNVANLHMFNYVHAKCRWPLFINAIQFTASIFHTVCVTCSQHPNRLQSECNFTELLVFRVCDALKMAPGGIADVTGQDRYDTMCCTWSNISVNWLDNGYKGCISLQFYTFLCIVSKSLWSYTVKIWWYLNLLISPSPAFTKRFWGEISQQQNQNNSLQVRFYRQDIQVYYSCGQMSAFLTLYSFLRSQDLMFITAAFELNLSFETVNKKDSISCT